MIHRPFESPPLGNGGIPRRRKSVYILGMMSEPTELECRQIAELLGDYLEGTLSQPLAELLEWHIESCAPCVAFVNTYRGTIDAARKLREVEIPPDVKRRLVAFLKAPRQAPPLAP
jgi:anti-sigma factor RsiW